jgi:imidazolonepropionase-like amidohydrolase
MLPEGQLRELDVLVRGGETAALCTPGARLDATEEVSVRGLTVLPGVIDAHVHLGQDITMSLIGDARRGGFRLSLLHRYVRAAVVTVTVVDEFGVWNHVRPDFV